MPKPIIAIDTETTGLQIKHGCRAFCVTAGDSDSNLFEWWFDVDPLTRNIHYPPGKVKNLFSTLSKYSTWVFHNSLFDLNVLQEITTPSLSRNQWQDLFSQVTIEDTQLLCHAENSLTSNALKPQSFLQIDYPEDDEKDLIEAVRKSRTIAKRLGWAIAEPEHPHLTALSKDKPKCDYWLPHTLAKHHPSLVPPSFQELCKRYALGDVERTLGLYYFFKNSFEPWRWKAYKKNARCLLPTFFMVNQGFALKEGQVPGTLAKLKEVRIELSSFIQELVETTSYIPPATKAKDYEKGDEFVFNEGSPPQLQKLLFTTLGLPKIKKTATGQPSTDKDTLETLLESEALYRPTVNNKKAVKILRNILGLRKVSTTERYLKNYKTYQIDNRLYPSLNPTGTKTLRYSCSNPNGQNISVKEPEGYEHLGVDFSLRHMFGPPEGYVWACIDYSQLQLRIFAYACGDRLLIDSFENGDDVHDAVARRVFNVAPHLSPTKEQRTLAKNINFGIIFGAGKNKIDTMTGIPGSFDSFREKFPLVDSFIKDQADLSRSKGYCLTMGKYPLHVNRSKAYKACNYVVQGTEGELVKDAIYRTYEYCKQPSILFFPVMTIHDEIIFQSKEPMSLERTKQLKPKSQLLTIQKLMNEAASSIGVQTEVECTLTDSLWSLAT